MAYVYKGIGGKSMAEYIAATDFVQADLEERTFAMAVVAEELLLEHIDSGAAYIDIAHGDIDWFVVLSDERGQKAALSIEYGRQADKSRGISEMDGLFILARATNSPIKRKGKVKL